MALDTKEKRQNAIGSGRPYLRNHFPVVAPGDAQWRAAGGLAYGAYIPSPNVICVIAKGHYIPGPTIVSHYVPGAVKKDVYIPGAVEHDSCS
jgi:hypothetical protein